MMITAAILLDAGRSFAVPVAFTAVSVLTLYVCLRKRQGIPPGPTAWPLVGNLFSMGRQSHLILESMRKTYGDVFSVYFGSTLVVVVNGKAVEECLSTHSARYSMRPELHTTQYILEGKSFAFSHIAVSEHKRYRTLAVAVVKQLVNGGGEKTDVAVKHGLQNGTRHSSIEDRIYMEAACMCDKLLETSDKPDLKDEILQVITKELCRSAADMLLGNTLSEYELDEISRVVENLRNSNEAIMLVNFIPAVRMLWRNGLQKYIQLTQSLNRFFERCIRNRKAQLATVSNGHTEDNGVWLTNGVDCTVKFWQKLKNDPQYEESRVMKVVADLFGARVDTMTVALAWMIVYWSTYQAAQERAQKEIDHFVKNEKRLPRYSERNQLPYTMALIMEVERHCSFVPFTLPHAPVQDTMLNGYLIPKGTMMLISMRSINHDTAVWDSPAQFRPERFLLDQSGGFNSALAEQVMLFGAGRRRCAGEALGRMQIFLYSVLFLRKCTFRRSDKDGHVLPESLAGISLIPQTMCVSISRREADGSKNTEP
uniref:Fumitremorgin C synthase n=1 Tax=Ciona intestinalis TaxID=7719 RepID=F6U9J6_CIOIN|nr:cytochrome P450 family 1 subfamily E polypeptide 1 [Ciona intestinalis]|eukprot:XP_002119171.1 cytochrome P450 1A2-like [Ciona intestinalis]